jgi:signal recognition particle GTPase
MALADSRLGLLQAAVRLFHDPGSGLQRSVTLDDSQPGVKKHLLHETIMKEEERPSKRCAQMNERNRLAEAARHMEGTKERIARQKKIIAELERDLQDTDLALEMLRALEQSLHALEQHRHVILVRLNRMER